jgi:threonylcarbamoyladenosine tRNA methylthiotransferase MtaB
MEAALRGMGWSVVDLDEGPDFSIINTCSVTGKSDYQSRQLIRRASSAGSKVIVTGCYSELNMDAVRSMEGVEMVVSNTEKGRIITMLAHGVSCNTLCYDGLRRCRFYLKVQDGCNHSCSYCLIPLARGRSRSMELEDVLSHVGTICENYRELVLSGIHLGTYGYDLRHKVKLSDLISAIISRTSVERIRLSSLEIGEIDDRLLEVCGDSRVCDHLHVPLQSGDDSILKAMNRNYDSKAFYDKLLSINQRLPKTSIGVDAIVGFPGETDKEFANTLNLLEALPISYIHVFPYSPRPGTVAASLPSQVKPLVKKERAAILREISAKKKNEYMRKQIGGILEVLVEDAYGPDTVTGITGNYLKVMVHESGATPKTIVPVRITGVREGVLLAYPI